jgi:hypothetical protein
MSDTLNPWHGPSAEAETEEAVFQGVVTPVMRRYLKETSPWLLFVGILGYMGAIFWGVTGLILGILTAARRPALGEGVAALFMGPAYLVAGGLIFFPSWFAHRCGLRIRRYLASSAEGDLEAALKNNRALWKFNGILAIVFLALGIGGIIVAVVFSLL